MGRDRVSGLLEKIHSEEFDLGDTLYEISAISNPCERCSAYGGLLRTDRVSEDPGLVRHVGEALGLLAEDAKKGIEELELLARVDRLTGLSNRLHFDEFMEQAVALANRGDTYSVVILDIDHFKRVNDTYGHVAGDYVLKEIGGIIKDFMRTSDVSCRYGGEEFALILPNTGRDDAYGVAEKLRKKVEAGKWEYDGKDIGKITISAGVGTIAKDESASDACHRIDARLYLAKRDGRNKVVL